ncbi:NADH-quinone oxidoreductase subunit L [Nocardia farcinica]|uniref:NADH-quinone oxidoreductase subunit 5 family protein n=1 Tax=Nocardia TaxID=1817 RepID=UPI001893DEA6|nr:MULTISPECIES: proton-conducting transporter membrane subunit [Nocardia]MBF6289944.1 NADH-quinone oxidoreductase subunit L [Nocardia cyriacigeorgica]MBF6422212.1 NADH-quinone oxidoreductase subunit L [Nocardia farcinica]MBF6433868.1 NADH-quinone oxidoreductase subunit L [Nocardia farcinica]MBF6504936.1 NADH-quinone oxidoreductase subunit L [Nocardia farcinica]
MLWSLIALPGLAGAALLVCGRRADRVAPVLGVAVAAVSTVLAALTAVERPSGSAPLLAGIPFVVGVDGLSAVMVVTVAAVTTAVLLFATGDLGTDQPRARFYGLMLVFAAAMLTTVVARNIATLLMAWEIMGATSYALIGFHWRDDYRVSSGLVAFLTTRTGDVGLYLAAGALLAGGDTELTLGSAAGVDGGWRDVVAAGVLLAALGKSAQLPFSFWLSRAMSGPSPVSALLHSATMVAAGAYLLLRMHPLLASTSWAGPTAAWIGVATAIVLGAVAVCQADLKQLLAASTCAQIGFVVVAAGAGGIAAGTGQLVAHAATKSLLFLGAGAWLSALGTKHLVGLRGVARAYPVVGVTFTIGALSLAGVPPFALWPSKDAVLAAALTDSVALYLAGLVAAVLSAGYAGRALVLVWSSPTAATRSYWDTEEVGTRRVNSAVRLSLVALAVGTVIGGAAVLPSVGGRFADLVGAGAMVDPAWWELGLSGLIAVLTVLVVGAVIRRRGDLPAPVLLADWFGLEKAVHYSVVVPTLTMARWLANFDDRVLNGGVYATATGTLTIAHDLDKRAEKRLDATVHQTASAARGLGRWARRPETGQVHQYYAQAVVGLLLLAVIVLTLR